MALPWTMIKRSGTFRAQIDRNAVYCGLFDSDYITYGWEAELVADRHGLDENGFLVDNRDLADIFEKTNHVEQSCELLAEYFVSCILDLCGDRRECVRRCMVTLAADYSKGKEPTAKVSHVYER